MAHARRKLFEANELNGSQIAGQTVAMIAKLYEIERQAEQLSPEDRLQIRRVQSKPVADELHAWLKTQRQLLVKADATAKAIDYALSNWTALTQFLDDGAVPIDNNAAENAIRPLAVGRKNWLFVGSQLAGERAAVLMSLIESAKLNGHDTVAEMAADAALLVLGEHPHPHPHPQGQHLVHTEHHLERAIRPVDRPVLVASAQAFDAPQRLVLAFDGQAGARRAVAALPHHPLCQGLPVLLAMAGARTPAAQQQLEQARSDLAATGMAVQTELLDGEPQRVLPALVKARGPALLVLGANSHSRLRKWVFGSTTATLLRLGEVPVLVLR